MRTRYTIINHTSAEEQISEDIHREDVPGDFRVHVQDLRHKSYLTERNFLNKHPHCANERNINEIMCYDWLQTHLQVN